MGGRGRKHLKEERQTLLELIHEAMSAGARQEKACELLGLSSRTLQRWRKDEDGGEDCRKGPKNPPANKFSEEEKKHVLKVVNSPEYRDLSPKQIVPRLADQGEYIGSESTIYRTLREAGQLKHRRKSRVPSERKPKGYSVLEPNRVWSWDITYLRSVLRGQFYYLYMVVDVWSRKIIGWRVEKSENMELSSGLIQECCVREGVQKEQLVLHSDNGSPMKGSTMQATLEALGVAASFSRPSVSNDNPFSESLFRTLKYRPEYPNQAFDGVESSRLWVEEFVQWYNYEHLHSGIGFVTPVERHEGESEELQRKRRKVYEKAREKHPQRWSGECRSWKMPKEVRLNQPKEEEKVPSPSASSSPAPEKGRRCDDGRRDGPQSRYRV